jgi:hypothetical protein
MPRPEKPIPGDGPLADLARELRQLRNRSGRTYRQLAPAGNYSPAQLAAAAAGTSCPTPSLVLAYARACEASSSDIARLQALRDEAEAARRQRASSRRSPGTVEAESVEAELSEPLRSVPVFEAEAAREYIYVGEPRPEQTHTAAQYIYQLGALRAWAGKPGVKEIARRSGNRGLAASSMYDALSSKRTTLPPLETVITIVRACAPRSINDWVATWRMISLRSFEDANPMPPGRNAARRPQLRAVGS